MSSSTPPPRAGSRSRSVGGRSTRNPMPACSERGVPNRPAAKPSRTARMRGWQAIHMASIRKRSCSRDSRTISSASAVLSVSGFSQSTCLPASKASRAPSRCIECGVAM